MIHSYKYCVKKNQEIGKVVEIKDFLVKVRGLPKAVIGEGVAFESGENGRVIKLEANEIEVLVFSRSPLMPGTKAGRSGSLLTVSCSDKLLGHTINTFGHLLSGHKKKSLATSEKRIIETIPVGISARKRISRFFPTGVAIVDLLVPIGFGQRELIIGDRKTGKTQFLLRTLIKQAQLGTVCIYCVIGKRKQEIKAIEEFFRKHKLTKNSIIVASSSHSSPGEIVYAPYTAITLAEYFRDKGRDVLLILDDMTTHAKYYREFSLLSGIFPGRESYPGDIFHVHSKLLERAGCFNVAGKEVTITCFPVVESVGSDLTGYIQTNLMSMTDGHTFFDSENFAEGKRPAVNIFLSVTRVGRQTLSPLGRDINSKLTIFLKKYEDAQGFLRFGSELSEEVKKTLNLGDGFQRLFKQTGFTPFSSDLQAIFISLIWLGLWNGKNAESLAEKISIKGKIFLRGLVESSSNLDDLNERVTKEKIKIRKFLSYENL